MKPVDQANFTPTGGDCFSACVASILEMPLAEVPFFNEPPAEEWWPRFKSWLHARDLDATFYDNSCGDVALHHVPPGFSIAGGASRRFTGVMHACVASYGLVVHDPHPSRAGLDKVADYIVIHGEGRRPLWFNGLDGARS